MKVLIMLALMLLISNVFAIKKPKWISGIEEYCPPTELCAVGEGAGLMQAETAARREISKIFVTKLKATTTFREESKQTSDGDIPISASSSEEMNGEIVEKTEQVLNGVVIKERFESSDGFYALASLKIKKAANTLKSEMKDLDERIKTFYQEGKRSSLNKALKKMIVREKLNIKYEFLNGSKYPIKVSFAQIMKKKKQKKALGTVVYVIIDEIQKTDEIKDIIITTLLEEDFRVVLAPKKFNYKLKVNIKSEKQYMKVKGFKKYKFLLRMESRNNKGAKLGALDYSTVQVGRTFKHAYDNAAPLIAKFITDKLGELNID